MVLISPKRPHIHRLIHLVLTITKKGKFFSQGCRSFSEKVVTDTTTENLFSMYNYS